MIFYFSGTGNSEGIAKIVGEFLREEVVNIVGKKPEDFELDKDRNVGFVFPIYAWAALEVMLEFVKKLHVKNSYTFAIATYSNVVGKALDQFAELLPLDAGFGITMPDNFPVLEKTLDSEESSMEKLEKASLRLKEVLEKISNQEHVFDVKEGKDAEENTFVKSHGFNATMRKTNLYYVTSQCIGCGMCERICPAQAIRMQEKKPVWVKEDCYLCMACLNRCPVEAIQYGKFSEGRYRYYFKGFDIKKYKNNFTRKEG